MGGLTSAGRGRRVPTSTYRLQLGPDLSFDEVRARLDYYVALGVTDLYLSPILQAAPGSRHGYDVVDHTRISDVIGGRAGFERLAEDAHARGLGIVVDIVPNHMAIPTPEHHNRAFWSVLGQGTGSPYESWFDIDWGAGDGRVLMPILGAALEDVLAAGELSLERATVPGHEGPQWVLRYHEHVLPVRRGTEGLALTDLVACQHYRLAHWRVADRELNFRRFFDVITLAGLRVEREDVFVATHALLLELFNAGLIDGFRVDHPDGLADPRGYFARLARATGGAWVVAEKILEADEELPDDWQVAGTTGYDAMWRVQGLFVDPVGARPLADVMTALTGDGPDDLPDLIRRAKREVLTQSLAAERERLTRALVGAVEGDARLRGHGVEALRECVAALVVELDRYRAYVVPGEPPSWTSRQVVAQAAARARNGLTEALHATLSLVADLILGGEAGAVATREAERADAMVRFQQVSGAVMAKGMEDTAFYRWTHLASLCEVGGAPHRFGATPDDLHAWAGHAATSMPSTMTAGSTHDTKRDEDVRARIGVLSQFPGEWAELVWHVRDLTSGQRPAAIDGRTENLLWQTLAGTWTGSGPIAVERLSAYLVKASRESRTWTSWRDPDAAAERALTDFVAATVTDPDVAGTFEAWVRRTGPAVRAAVLGSKLVQLTLPGVADVYQGTESHVIALVDPDNRRPVHAAGLAARLQRMDAGDPARTLADEKLAITAAALRLRRAARGAFVGARSGYQPVGTSSPHAVAFARTGAGLPQVVTIATRLTESLAGAGGWGDHTVDLPEGLWRDVLSGGSAPPIAGGPQPVGAVLATRPVALLARIEAW